MRKIEESQDMSLWLVRMPAYRGLFTYEVGDEAYTPLGSGIFLWQLEILADTMEITEANGEGTTVQITCQMKKTLLDLPEDACVEIQRIKKRFVIEQWFGEADLASKAFNLNRIAIDSPPVDTTIDFDSIPILKRDVLAGHYEFVLEGSVLQSVHRSWVELAHLEPEDATGFMLRVPAANPVCPMLLPEQASDVDMKLAVRLSLFPNPPLTSVYPNTAPAALAHQTARTFLKETKAHRSDDDRIVNYTIQINRVTDITTQDESFNADLGKKTFTFDT